MRKLLRLAVLVLLASVFGSSASAEEIQIGAIVALSGSMQQYGQWATRGFELALEDINARRGGAVPKVSLRYEDNQGQPQTAISAFRKLHDALGVRYFLTYQSSIALAVEPLANRAGVVQMDVSAFAPVYSTPDDYTFRTGILAEPLARALARELTERFKVERVAALVIENEKGEASLATFVTAFQGTVPFKETFRPGETDFRSLLLRLKQAKLADLF